MIRRLVWPLLLTAAVAAAGVTVAAHMKVAKSDPAANATVSASPARIRVWFTQAPDAKVSRLELAGAAGPAKLSALQANADKSIAATVEGALADGRYTVRWQAAGDDGHVQKGSYVFTVQQAR